MDITLNKSFLDKTRTKASKDAEERYDDEYGEKSLQYDDLPYSVEEMKIEDDHIHVGIVLGELEDDMGYMSLDIPLGIDDLTTLIELSVKKLNKFKTAIEVLK